jgi:hypothetical protein
LSQVFKATQAPTSPLIHGLPSDEMSERPSEFYFNQRLAAAGTSSSPVKLQRTNFQRAVTEPQTTYVPMKESQTRRERALGLGRSSSMNGLPVNEDSDEDFGSEGSLLRRRRIQRKIDEQAKSQFAGLTAPLRPSSSGRERGKVFQDGRLKLSLKSRTMFRRTHLLSRMTLQLLMTSLPVGR